MVILADETAPVEYVAWDLIAQAEHDPDVKTLLITTSEPLCREIHAVIENCVKKSPRKDIINRSLNSRGGIIQIESVSDGIAVINTLAPEHVEIITENPAKTAHEIRNAGAVFLGTYTPGAVGDYWAGPNHTLPTGGAAKFASPLNVLDFMKFTSFTGYTKEALRKARSAVCTFARAEKLSAHAQSVEARNGSMA